VIAVSEFVGKVTGVDVNEGMLRQVKGKGTSSHYPFLTSSSIR